jgi:hypothetical protein
MGSASASMKTVLRADGRPQNRRITDVRGAVERPLAQSLDAAAGEGAVS